ncbi:hypothetical protein [Mesorhizobium sp. M0910]|uniref:hypothetical protein n=1 Tax=Mesorhizobium sp. M0910 TaxID=2957025 RepID=UPI00333C9EB2
MSGLPASALKAEEEATKVTAKAATNAPNFLLENFPANIIVSLSPIDKAQAHLIMSINFVDYKVPDAVLCRRKEKLFACNAHFGHTSFTKLRTAKQHLGEETSPPKLIQKLHAWTVSSRCLGAVDDRAGTGAPTGPELADRDGRERIAA